MMPCGKGMCWGGLSPLEALRHTLEMLMTHIVINFVAISVERARGRERDRERSNENPKKKRKNLKIFAVCVRPEISPGIARETQSRRRRE